MPNPIVATDAVFAQLVSPRKRFIDDTTFYADAPDWLEDPDEPLFDPWGDLDLGMPND